MGRWLFFGLISVVLIPTAAVFAMSSTNYGIDWDSVNSGGDDTSTSTNFQLRDTVGEQGTGLSASQNYQIGAGYRQGDTQETSLTLLVQTQENQTSAAWTAFSNASKTVTVPSNASYSTGTFIGVIENQGAAQLVAFGKITSIAGSTITVDSWSGEPASLSASPSGGDDVVYRLGGSTAGLGTGSLSAVRTALTVVDALSNVESGYTITVQASTTLMDPLSGLSIQDVKDGAVSANSEEYGAEAVGTLSVSAGDFAFSSTSTRPVQTSATFGDHDRTGLIYKLSINSGTPTGNYQQMLYYRLTPNF